MRRVILGITSAVIASVLLGASVQLSLLFNPSGVAPEWWISSDSSFSVLVIALVLFGIGAWRLSQQMDAGRDDLTQQVTSALVALAVIAIIWLLWKIIGSVSEFGIFVGTTMVFYGILHSVWTYFQHRSQTTRADVAMARTQEALNRDISNMSSAVFGLLLLGLSIVLGLWSSISEVLPALGDILLPYSPEIAYLGTVVMGYLAVAGTGFFGEMGAAEWATVALVIGALALVVRR